MVFRSENLPIACLANENTAADDVSDSKSQTAQWIGPNQKIHIFMQAAGSLSKKTDDLNSVV